MVEVTKKLIEYYFSGTPMVLASYFPDTGQKGTINFCTIDSITLFNNGDKRVRMHFETKHGRRYISMPIESLESVSSVTRNSNSIPEGFRILECVVFTKEEAEEVIEFMKQNIDNYDYPHSSNQRINPGRNLDRERSIRKTK